MRLASDPLPTLSIYKQHISVYAISDKKMKKGERNLSRQRERETFEPQMNTSFILSITNSSADIRLSSMMLLGIDSLLQAVLHIWYKPLVRIRIHNGC